MKEYDCNARAEGNCVGAMMKIEGKDWVEAAVSIRDGHDVVFSSSHVPETDKIVATRYGWGAVPMMTLYDADTNLPVLPWNEEL